MINSKVAITENQKKIIIISCAGFLVFLLLWIFLYLPAAKEIRKLKGELASVQQQINVIESFLSGSQNRDQALRLLKEKQQYLSNRFPQKEEGSLKLIPEFARQNKIQVISLAPGAKTEFLDKSGKQLIIDGKTAYYLPITMEMNGFYKDLVRYLLELKNNLPAFASVISLSVKKIDQSSGKVRANVEFNLYLLI